MRRAYLRAGPCQPILKPTEYPVSGPENHRRRFQASWFQTYSTWLEYSESKDAIFCHPCYIFAKKSTGCPGSDAFTVKGFKNWKKVNDGMNCPLLGHVGTDPNSPHKIAVKCCEDLKNYSRGHDESSDSKNQGNFIELIKFVATFNDKVDRVVLTNAPRNAKYTSPQIQKEILHIFATKVRDVIRKEIGDAKFCILVDEARDESKREQMAIILRFVDKDGFIRERFFHIVHVKDTTALTLNKKICDVLSCNDLKIQNIRASREAKYVHQFFENLNFIINIVVSSSKCNDELQSAQVAEIEIFDTISKEGTNYSQRGDAEAAYMVLTSFEFVLILHLMKEIMGFTHCLCQALQQNSQDILNAMKLVSTTKSLLQNLRNEKWEHFLDTVKSFCEKNEIDVPDMNGRYTGARGKSCRQNEESFMTMEHHFRIDVFIAAIDFQLQELDNRFSEHAVELLRLSAPLSPQDAYKSFKIDDICSLVEKFYPQDFTEQEKIILRFQLDHYKLDVPNFQNMSTLSKLCRGLAISGKSKIYNLIDRLIRLVLTLPVSTATTERAFSAMKLVKTRLRSRMEDEFLANNLVVYIEKEIAKDFTTEMIMDEFYSMKDRRR
ncbi:uncharacterized protein LOC133873313 [Alnus glutinosa]|uniref:uncharacterized protein LOC133873313 n=1 Tax=Alnus glutinosa TaxID=3517 RepID=UPI002D764D0A|nr:uncharacterized protein LOC133873313 [Alnus glutinosa]